MSALYQREAINWRDKVYKLVFRLPGDGRTREVCGNTAADLVSWFRRVDLIPYTYEQAKRAHPAIDEHSRDTTSTTVCDGPCVIKHRQTMAEYGYKEVHQDCTLA
jgi:hypothetical protein